MAGNRNPLSVQAPPGSVIWNKMADLLEVAPGLNLRPMSLPFRATTLAANVTFPDVGLRVDPNFHFYWTQTSAYMQALAGVDVCAHATIQVQGGAGIPVFAPRPMPFTAFGTSYRDSTGVFTVWTPNTLCLMPHAMEWAFAAGEDITVTWVCDGTFPAGPAISDFVMHGIGISSRLSITQVKQVIELATLKQALGRP